MQTVTLSLFRFKGLGDKLWAFGQMGLAHRHLRRTPNLDFYQLFGAGTGEGFTPRPDFGLYGLLGVWSDETAAARQADAAPVIARYRDRAVESYHLHLRATRSWGDWSGVKPFATPEAQASPHNAADQDAVAADDQAPIAILTRASLSWRGLRRFWGQVPGVSARIGADADVLFKQGLGEKPWTNQVTFSIWPNLATMRRFAYGDGAHLEAVRRVRDEGWFTEELYARFDILAHYGSWRGGDPLAAADDAKFRSRMRSAVPADAPPPVQ